MTWLWLLVVFPGLVLLLAVLLLWAAFRGVAREPVDVGTDDFDRAADQACALTRRDAEIEECDFTLWTVECGWGFGPRRRSTMRPYEGGA